MIGQKFGAIAWRFHTKLWWTIWSSKTKKLFKSHLGNEDEKAAKAAAVIDVIEKEEAAMSTEERKKKKWSFWMTFVDITGFCFLYLEFYLLHWLLYKENKMNSKTKIEKADIPEFDKKTAPPFEIPEVLRPQPLTLPRKENVKK